MISNRFKSPIRYFIYIFYWIAVSWIIHVWFCSKKNDPFLIEFTGKSILKIDRKMVPHTPQSVHMDLDYDRLVDKIVITFTHASEHINEIFVCMEFKTKFGFAIASLGSALGGNRVSAFHQFQYQRAKYSSSSILDTSDMSQTKLGGIETRMPLIQTFPYIWETVAGSKRIVLTLNFEIERDSTEGEKFQFIEFFFSLYFFFKLFILITKL